MNVRGRSAFTLIPLIATACATPPRGPTSAPAPPVAAAPEPEPPVLTPNPEAVETSTAGFASEPLETPWWSEPAPTASLLTATGTVSFDLPQSDDPSVTAWVELISGRGRRLFSIWLARSSRYVPLFFEILDRHQLPRDLVFLAMVESGFSPRAHSWASASGPWQFMPVTARRYGLRVGFWVDERRDFVKSTEAAARHLSWLYSVFEDWHLAMAAYNAGSGKVRSAIRRHEKVGAGTDFWTLQRGRRLRRETKQYVPKILAAAIIAKTPEQFGIYDVPYLPPVRFEVIEVSVATALSTIAEACGGLPVSVLEDLNPELRVGVTPPGETWRVRVPPGLEGDCTSGLVALPEELRWTFRYHEPSEGESVNEIARRFSTSVEDILRFHGVDDPTRMADFAEIAVPIRLAGAHSIPIGPKPDSRRARGGRYAPGEARLLTHRVRSGESLWKLSRRYDVPMRKIASWNGLSGSALQIGQKLKIYVKPGGRRAPAEPPKRSPPAQRRIAVTGPTTAHTVEEGESLWIIARRYRTSVEVLMELNSLSPRDVLGIGQVIMVPRPSESTAPVGGAPSSR